MAPETVQALVVAPAQAHHLLYYMSGLSCLLASDLYSLMYRPKMDRKTRFQALKAPAITPSARAFAPFLIRR